METEKKQEVVEKEEFQENAKKIERDPNLKYTHPLMNCRMNLLEINHRTIEVVQKFKMNVVGRSEGDIEEDIKKFKDFLFETLVELPK